MNKEVQEVQTYGVWEGHMDYLKKKVTTIQNKCRRFGCDFSFKEVGEEIREVPSLDTDPVSGKPIMVKCKYILVQAEGTAIVNGWEFVASVEHTEKGNIFSKAMTDVEIPERYRCSDPYCEHCNSHRLRKNTFIIRNSETGEFKQVGKSCLKDFTNGMSASFVTWLASVKDVFEETEDMQVGFLGGWFQRYYDTKEILQMTAETIRHFGYSKTDDGDSTKDRMTRFLNVLTGNTKWMDDDLLISTKVLMKRVGFNPDSEEAVKMAEEAVNWIQNQEANNDYMHNLKVVTSLDHVTSARFGLLVSLFPTYNRELEYQAKKKEEAQKGKISQFIGQVGDRILVDVDSIRCITSWESCFDGYNTTTTYVWKIVGKDGNIYTWKTSKWMNDELPPKSIKGTVKGHKTFREVKQTELTRCKIA